MRDVIDKYSRIIFWPALIIILSWASWVVISGKEEINLDQQDVMASEMMDEATYAVVYQPFMQELTEDGIERFRLNANRIINESETRTEFAEPQTIYTMESGEVIEVTGDGAIWDRENEIVILTGNVAGISEKAGFRFFVDELQYYRNEDVLVAPGEVLITREGIELTGNYLKVDLNGVYATLELGGGDSIVTVTSSMEALEELSNSD